MADRSTVDPIAQFSRHIATLKETQRIGGVDLSAQIQPLRAILSTLEQSATSIHTQSGFTATADDLTVDVNRVICDKPDLSVLDGQSLAQFKAKQQESLRLKLLNKLLFDEIVLRQCKNLKKYRSFREMLEATVQRYHDNAISAAEVIQTMIRIRQEMRADDQGKVELNLSDEELASYDAIVELQGRVYDVPFLRDLIHEIVDVVKRNLKVDWTKPHREDVKAAVMAAVKMVLRWRKVRAEDFDFILKRVMDQAAALYETWPVGRQRGESDGRQAAGPERVGRGSAKRQRRRW